MGSSLLDMELQQHRLAELQQQLDLKNVQLDAVLQLTQAINYNFSNAALFEIYGYLLSTELRVDRFLMYLEEGDWCKYASKGVSAEGFAARPDYFASCEQIKWLDTQAQLHFPGFEVLIPVVYKQQPLAYVLIGGFDWPQETQKELFQYIQAVSNILAVSNENRKLFQQQIQQQKIQQELSLAAQMQGLLIPDKLPHDAQLEMSAVYLPHRDVGGDYYDVVKFESGELVFCVADVSGKGIPAALLMSNFQAVLRALIHFHPNLRKLVAELNKSVLNITKGDKFITLFIGKLDPRNGLLKYINAGHVPPFLLRAGEVTELKEGTTILGMFDELPFLHVGKVQLEPGDVLFTYTDGVTEVSDYRGRAFDMKQLGGLLAPQKEESLHSANKRFLEALIKFKGDRNFADDLTVLSLRYQG
jgi:phosphoserine phosphatase RsbU/P